MSEPLYSAYVTEFVRTQWSIPAAAGRAESLARAIACLRRLAGIAT